MAAAHPFPETVIFDLDGTLVDTAPDVTRAVNYVLRSAGRRAIAPAQVRNLVGRGSRALIAEALAASGHPGASNDEVERLLPAFLDFYGANIALESRPFAGAVDILKILSNAGVRLAVCTNKFENLSRRLLAALDLEGYFHANLGGDSLDVRKPHPRHLLAAIAAAGGRPETSAMIGDSRTDVATAKAAGVPVILVDFGYSDVPIESLEADAVISHFAALPSVLADILSARA
ncbi:MAG: phosphoglycolate phosphatase [Alphaproteobacteria bacterium]|nr:MAG: phosphoglycolate phosphatase [Alphaproteobacteria bacterium]